MCVSCSDPAGASTGPHPSRRSVLGAAGGLAAAGLALGPVARAEAAGRVAPSRRRRGLEVVLLGTAGGPPPHADRAGIASAVVVDGATYLVDAGRAAMTQYVRAGLTMASLSGVFITHLHADHVADYFNLFLLGGNVSPAQADSAPDSTPVYGPGPAGGLPPTYGGGTSPTTAPDAPTPGLADLTDRCSEAFAYSTNVFMRDSHIRETRSLIDVHELATPNGASYEATAPAMAPMVVMEDDRVRVTAVLVPHGPVFPAFAYRFDTDHGSVTFSGDTTYSDNLVDLARSSDLLVHEAINVRGWDGPDAVKDHLLQSHVEVQKVGPVAQAADVERLVLSHVGDLAADVIDERRWQRWAQRGYDGRVKVGRDLASYSVG